MVSFTQPDRHGDPAAAPLAPIADATGGPLAHLPPSTIEWVALDKIEESKLNPRKDFDKDSIADLAESIRAQGLQQNLLVRPTKKPGVYELIGGARRLRALRLIKAEGAMCKVTAVTDDDLIAGAIVENLQREDLSPLEEAEAFAKLQAQDPAKWTAAAIGKAIGKSDRFVSQRLAIATTLAAPLKEKFSEGKITVEAARTLASFPPSVQKQVPGWAIEQNRVSDIRRIALDICIPEAAARFDVKTYTGEWIDAGKGKKFFADIPQFMKLQTPAAEKKLAEIRTEWPAAEIITEADAGQLYWADETYPGGDYSTIPRQQRDGDKPRKFHVPKDKCRAVVWIAANGQIRKALGVCTANAIHAAANKRPTGAASSRFKTPEGEKKEHKAARLAFNAALQTAAMRVPDLTESLLIFNTLLDVFGTNISGAQVDKLLPDALRKAVPAGYSAPAAAHATLWREITKLTIKQRRTIAHGIMLAEVPTWDDFDHKTKPVLMVAMAETFGLKPPAIALPEPPATKAAVPKKPAAKKKAARK